MPTYPPQDFVTEEQYLVSEPQAEYKSEYRNGRVVAMSGSSLSHVVIKDNLLIALKSRFKGKPCQAYGSDMRVKVEKAKFYTYPDLTVVCGKLNLDGRETATLANPKAIFEVLSPSTEKYDRGEKFDYLKKLDTLRDYVLISQDQVRVEHFTLVNGIWMLADIRSLDEILDIASIGCRVPLSEVYEQVTF